MASIIASVDFMTVRGINISIVKKYDKFQVFLGVLKCLKSNVILFREVL